VFKDEIGVDRGGVSKELFSIALRDIIFTKKNNSIFSFCQDDRFIWFKNTTVYQQQQEKIDNENCG
jgi:hypothetical protein